MNEYYHAVLCVDDEINILNSLKRLLRKENYLLLTATNGDDALNILERHDNIHVIMSDQRMPGMTGTEFFAKIKDRHPDIIRIILSGYTDVDSITESINKGHIYKFFLKPWNDQTIKLEIIKALDQYDLMQANREFHDKIMMKNEELKDMNDQLEDLVKKRTNELELRNQALEIYHAILDDLPVPIIGISISKMIVFINKRVNVFSSDGRQIELGKNFGDYFSEHAQEILEKVLSNNKSFTIKDYDFSGIACDIEMIPLSGRFSGKGALLTIKIKDEDFIRLFL